MKFLQEHQLKITTLAPVHIGCGEDYTPTDYVIDDKTLFAFDSTAVNDALPENACNQLKSLVSGNRQDDVLKQIQRLFHEHRESLMTKANHYLPVASGVADHYERRIGQTAQREDDGKRVINQLHIERTFYNPTNQRPVIPGSSLKGAIRTALLDFINNNKELADKEKQFLQQKQEREQQRANQELQQRLFDFHPGKRHEIHTEGFEKDPMRLIYLDDTHCARDDVIHSEICFAVNRPRREPAQGQSHRTMAEDKSPYQLLETLPELSLRTYSSRLTIQKVSQLKQENRLPANKFCWTIEQIAQACNKFYLPLLKQEMKMIGQRSYVEPDWEQRMYKLLDSIEPLFHTNKAMLLRVGRHSGAEAVTLNGVRHIKIIQGGNKDAKYEPRPRTLWLAADVQDLRSGMVPFGWLLIEIDPPDKPLVTLENLIEQADDLNQQWLEKQQRRIKTLQEELTRRKQQEEAKRQEQLAEWQAEQEEQQRLASMTEEERAIEELKTWFDQDQANNKLTNQGRVPGRLHELITGASNWPKETRITLCDLAETIYHPLGMLKGKKGKERKARIEKLRE